MPESPKPSCPPHPSYDAQGFCVRCGFNGRTGAHPVVETSQADEAAWIGYDDSNASGYGEHAAFLAGRASAKAEQAPGQPSPIVRMRPCVSCSAGGDHEAKQCALREDTGVPNEPVWLCDECYDDWRQQP